jgi:hypothetical protein
VLICHPIFVTPKICQCLFFKHEMFQTRAKFWPKTISTSSRHFALGKAVWKDED